MCKVLLNTSTEQSWCHGLIECFGNVLKLLGVDNILDVLKRKPILVGGGTDGATINVSHQN